MSQLSSLSTMYVKVPISAMQSGVVYNPTSDTVQMAFLAEGVDPTGGDWKAASWETSVLTGGGVEYLARCLVGPLGTITLAKGKYRVWVKVADSPETPVLTSDVLNVT